MYSLVARIAEGLKELKGVLEEHIHNQGIAAIAKCGDAAANVFCFKFVLIITETLNHYSRIPKFMFKQY